MQPTMLRKQEFYIIQLEGFQVAFQQLTKKIDLNKVYNKPCFLILVPFPAERVTNNLKELAQQVAPGDIVSTYGIWKAMGISVPLRDTGDNSVDLTEGE